MLHISSLERCTPSGVSRRPGISIRGDRELGLGHARHSHMISVMTDETFNRYSRIPVSQLRLDGENPRLLLPESPSQEYLTQRLYEEESLDELAPSFAENGFFAEEPLVVIPEGNQADIWIVVEGNRRLATIKLLLDLDLRERVSVDGWPMLDVHQRRLLEEIPCVKYNDRDEVFPYLGFRHITGAKKWDPFQRARFVSQLVDSGRTLSEIEELVGDSTRAVKKLYQDFIVHRQVKDETDFPVRRLTNRFSLLEVLLSQRPVKSHLGIPRALPNERTDYVVPEEKLDDLVEILGWVFGDGTEMPVITDSREISKNLAPVIASPEALQHLRVTRNLMEAYDRTDGELVYLNRKLRSARSALEEVIKLLPQFQKDNEARSHVEAIVKLTKGIEKLAEGA